MVYTALTCHSRWETAGEMWPYICQLQQYLVFLQDAEKEKMKEKKNGCTDAGPRFVGILNVEALE